jgi:hypothetical protein
MILFLPLRERWSLGRGVSPDVSGKTVYAVKQVFTAVQIRQRSKFFKYY